MKRETNFAAAAIFTMAISAAATSVSAEPEFQGDFSIYGGNLSLFNDADGDDFNGGTIAGVNARLQYGMLQLDLNGEAVNTGNGDRYTAKSAALHFIAPLETSTIGAMFSVGSDGPGDVTVGGGPYTTFALEVAGTVGNTQVDSQLGRFTPDENSYFENGYYLHLGTATPLTENLSLKLNASMVRMSEADSSDFSYLQGYTYGAFVEYATSQKAIFYAGVTGNHMAEPSESEKWSVASITLGVRLPLGNATKNTLVFADHNPLTGVHHARLNDWQ